MRGEYKNPDREAIHRKIAVRVFIGEDRIAEKYCAMNVTGQFFRGAGSFLFQRMSFRIKFVTGMKLKISIKDVFFPILCSGVTIMWHVEQNTMANISPSNRTHSVCSI